MSAPSILLSRAPTPEQSPRAAGDMFGDVLNEAGAGAIHAFIIDEARKQLQQAGDHETH